MPAPILVAYATTYGSTQEVAEVIAATLREHHLEVEVQPMRQVHTLVDYRAVILGAPLYIGRWHKDARRFLARHRPTLAQRPVAVFALGPLRADEQEWQDAREQLQTQLSRVLWLKPIALELFGGKIDPARLHFPWKALPARKKLFIESDQRDWAAIRAWASALAVQLQPTPTPAR
jgi:menaquinone-dependent protoporphyrinogen oxidase